MLCTQCGTAAADDAIYCSKCGDPLLRAVAEQLPPAGFLDLTRRTNATFYLLWAFAGLAALALASDLVRLQLLSTATFNIIDEPVANNVARHRVLEVLHAIMFISSAVAFLLWTYRANSNCRALGAQGMISPGWSVGWYFVPIANLWKPYQAMEEIWQASKNPQSWQRVKRPGIVTCWWYIWLANLIATNFTLTWVQSAKTSDDLIRATNADLFVASTDVLAAILAAWIIAKVHLMQETWIGSLALSNPTPSPQQA